MKSIRLTILTLALFGTLTIPALSRADNQLEQIALSILSEKFGIGRQQALDFQSQSNQNVFDAAPVYSTSYYTHRPVNEVWKLRQQGLGWGEIAHRLGMNPGQFNKLRKSGAFDRNAIWDSVCRDRYGARESDLAAIRRRGGSVRDALPACIIANRSHTSPATVYQRYQRDRDWDRTASSYKVDWRNHANYAGHSALPNRATPVKVGRDQRRQRGQWNAHRKEQGNHPDRNTVHGKDHDKGRGQKDDKDDRGNHGQGYGKGHDKGEGHGNGKGHGKSDG